MYEFYKPLRNLLSKVDLHSALVAMWHYWNFLEYGKRLPNHLHGPENFRDILYKHQLATITREILLNCNDQGEKEFTRITFSKCFNLIRDIEGFIARSRISDSNPDQVLYHLHSIVHHQAPLNKDTLNFPEILRYYQIFGSEKINDLLIEKTSLDLSKFLFFALLIGGGLASSPFISSHQDLIEFGISSEETKAFFQKMSQPICELRNQIKASSKYDENWEYTWNPLSSKPFFWLSDNTSDKLYCPTPSFIWGRIRSGLFYDLNNMSDFGNAFGTAFEKYIGDFSESVLPSDRFKIRGERQYTVGKKLKHGTDWIVSDISGHMFVECKTKRLKQEAKLLGENHSLSADLTILANAGLQIYKNLDDVLRGLTDWTFDGLKFYPVLITLEDWIIFSPIVKRKFDDLLREKVNAANLPDSLINDFPITIASCQEFEQLLLAVRTTGIKYFFDKKSEPQYEDWMVSAFINNAFPTTPRFDQSSFNVSWKKFAKDITKKWQPKHQEAFFQIPFSVRNIELR